MQAAVGIEAPPESATDAPVLNLSQLDVFPVPVRRVPPRFGRGEGTVIVAFIVDTEGRTRNVHAIPGSNPDLAAAAEDAVRQWQFRPGRKAGKPVNTAMQAPLVSSRGD